MLWILRILMFVAAPIAGLFAARDTLNFTILQTMITILLIVGVLSSEVVCSEAEGGGAVGDAVVETAPDERYVTGGDPDRRLRVVQPQPGMTPDDGVDGELDGAGQAQPPRGSCD